MMAFSGLTAGQIAALARTPALDPPPGVSPNFDNRYRFKLYLYSVLISTLSLLCVSLCVIIRIYLRNYVSKKLWWDDYLSVLAWLGLISFTIVGLLMIKAGAGTHQWDMYRDLHVQMMYIRYIADVVYMITILIVKVSILLQYVRILVPNRYWNKGFYYAAHFLIWTNFLFFTTEAVLFLCACTPRARIWNRKIPGHCLSMANLSLTAVFNIVSDFCILILPLHTIWHLQMDTRRKVGISLIFGAGVFACFTSIMRLEYSLKVMHSEDKSFLQLGIHCWMYAEISVGIICGCLPSLPVFIRHVKSCVQSRSQSRSTWGRKQRTSSKGAQKLEDQFPELAIREQSQFDQPLETLRTVSQDSCQNLAATETHVSPSKQENSESVPKEDPEVASLEFGVQARSDFKIF